MQRRPWIKYCRQVFILLIDLKWFVLLWHFSPLLYGFVWIEFIVVEIEIWKHRSKIIFKCVNSVVGPVNSAWIIHEQCMNSVFCPLHGKIMWFYCLRVGGKKKAWKRRTKNTTFNVIQTGTISFQNEIDP